MQHRNQNIEYSKAVFKLYIFTDGFKVVVVCVGGGELKIAKA